MYNRSETFLERIQNPSYPQKCLLVFNDVYFDNDDIYDSGVTFGDYFSTSENLTFGDCPSNTVSFSLISNGILSGYEFGIMRAYVGVITASEAYQISASYLAHVEVGGKVFDAGNGGIFIDGERLVSGAYHSLLSDTEYVYAFGTSSSIRIKISDSSYSAISPNKILVQKLATSKSAVFDANNAIATVWVDGEKQTWEYCPMGVYDIEKPRKTTDDIVNIEDGRDLMKVFDVDSADFIGSLTYPTTLSQIYTKLCEYVGVEYESATFLYSTTQYEESPFSTNATKLRDILSYIASRARSIAHFNRLGKLELKWLSAEAEETLETDNMALDESDIAEYSTEPISGVLFKSTQGASISFGDKTNPYPVYANPFITTITASDLAAYKSLLTYTPMSVSVIYANPAIDVGDLIAVTLSDDYVLLVNRYGEVYGVQAGDPEFRLYANTRGEVLAKEDHTAIGKTRQNYEALYDVNEPVVIPLMQRTLRFDGMCSAVYEATGEKFRDLEEVSNTEYNASVAVSQALKKMDETLTQEDIFNRLTGGGEQQGIYLYDGKIYINGEYIKADSISASKITAGTITADVTATNLNITGGSVNIYTSSGTTSAIVLQYGGRSSNISPYTISLTAPNDYYSAIHSYSGFHLYDYRIINDGVVSNYLASFSSGKSNNLRFGSIVLYQQTGENSQGIPTYQQGSTHSPSGLHFMNGSSARSYYDPTMAVIRNSSGITEVFINASSSGGVISVYDTGGSIARAVLDQYGLRFYDSTGVLTKNYPCV